MHLRQLFLFVAGLMTSLSACSENASEASSAGQVIETAVPAQVINLPPTGMKVAQEALRNSLEKALQPVEGSRGAAVLEVGTREAIIAGDRHPMPQQSVSKIWVSMTVADMVSKGRASYSDKITVSSADRTVFHQPLSRRVANGPITTTVGDLMEMAITRSDNMANGVLTDFAGGPGAVQRWLIANAPEIRFGPGDRVMQSGISGLAWDPSYSDRQAFERARQTVSDEVRTSRFNQYAANPIDGASTEALVHILAKIRMNQIAGSGDVLSLMARTTTGASRLKAGVPASWKLLHKTGTGQTWKGRRAGFNDIGILESPEGRSYAVAVMIGNSSSSQAVMQEAIADVAQSVIAYDAATNQCCKRNL